MNKQELDNLIITAEKHIGKEIEVNISLKPNIIINRTFKFENINSTEGFSENGEEMKYRIPSGNLKSKDDEIIKMQLTAINNYFENSSKS